MITISTPLGEATINAGMWKSGNKELEIFLNNIVEQDEHTPDNPDPDKSEAEKAIKVLKGNSKILAFTKPDNSEQLIY